MVLRLLTTRTAASFRQRAALRRLISTSSIFRTSTASSQAPTRFRTSPDGTTFNESNVLHQLQARGMLADVTSRAVTAHVEKPTTVYLGVDPSAASLHVGNLLAMIGLLHFSLHGHSAIALIGGATGSVGDPSGRSTERNALDPAVLAHNIDSITAQVTKFFASGAAFAESRTKSRLGPAGAAGAAGVGAGAGKGKVVVENNLDWLGGVSLLQFLGSVGKQARISTMLSRESVKSRLDSSSGLSFTEFTYQLLQAYDFLHLHRLHNCTLQLGGSDQLGNILSGVDLIRKDKLGNSNVEEMAAGEGKDEHQPAYGVTMPLLTTSTGEKFGKSAGNAVWLDSKLTSPFEFYQFFLKTRDEDVEKYLKIFTFIRVIELEAIMEDHMAQPNERVAQKILASEVTELIHGASGLRQALAFTQVCYGGDLSSIDIPSTLSALEGTGAEPSMLVRLTKEDVLEQSLETLLIKSGLVPSKTRARKAIEAGTIHLNGVKIPPASHQRTLEQSDLLQEGMVVLRTGKTAHKVVVVK